MSEMRQIPHSLKEMDSFSRQEYTDAMASNYSIWSPSSSQLAAYEEPLLTLK